MVNILYYAAIRHILQSTYLIILDSRIAADDDSGNIALSPVLKQHNAYTWLIIATLDSRIAADEDSGNIALSPVLKRHNAYLVHNSNI